MNEITIIEGDDFITVQDENLPDIISNINAIDTFSVKVDECKEKAKDAQEKFDKLKRYEKKGKGIFQHRSGNTKDIIESMQNVIGSVFEAQQELTKAINESFKYQEKLANASKYLFGIGCSNIAANRMIVREIEAKLNGASKEKISELAKQEMLNVLKQLKDQENILKKQEDLKNKVNKIDEQLTEQKKQIDNLQSILSETERIVDEQAVRISDNANDIKKLCEFKDFQKELLKEQTKAIEELKNRKDYGKLSIVSTVLSVIAIVLGIINIVL